MNTTLRTLLDRVEKGEGDRLVVTPDGFRRLQAALTSPPAPTIKLRELMQNGAMRRSKRDA